VACKDGDKFVEVGRVSSGLKEKEEEGMTYEEMTKLLQKLKTSEENGIMRVKPKLVVAVTYQNIQPSPSYSSGYALRFPRITAFRPDRQTGDIATLQDIKKTLIKG
jgi:DNA ligase-1